MKALLEKYFLSVLSSHKVSLALVLGALVVLTPSYNNYLQLIHQVEAHEKRFNRLEIIDTKLNIIMIELGITKFRIESIEKRNYTKPKGE